jgi:hypothetical protein
MELFCDLNYYNLWQQLASQNNNKNLPYLVKIGMLQHLNLRTGHLRCIATLVCLDSYFESSRFAFYQMCLICFDSMKCLPLWDILCEQIVDSPTNVCGHLIF